MAGRFDSIFRQGKSNNLDAPGREKPLMRVLEPRILLDAASVETALDIAGQAVHNQLADDYMANSRAAETAADNAEPLLSDADDDAAIDEAPKNEIVFIDAAVPDQQNLLAAIEPGVRVVMLDAGEDGIAQILAALDSDETYDAVHIFAHGSAGRLELGSSELTATTISGQYRDQLQRLGEYLGEDADILLYGCSFGEGADGKRAAALLAHATGADIAASDDLTGHESLSGDWDLEVEVGTVTSDVFAAPDWRGILGPSFNIEPVIAPDLTHASNGIVGTTGTIATWTGAVTFDPGGGAPIETYDIRATLLQQSANASATFDTTMPGGDLRVVVTNTGAEIGMNGPDRILETGTVGVLWEIVDSVTGMLADPQEINITFTDLDGRVGAPMLEESIGIGTSNLHGYTTEAGTDLAFSDDAFNLNIAGTMQGDDSPLSQVKAYWASANQFLVSYSTNTTSVGFDMDGSDDAVFANPEFTPTQELDLDGDDSTAAGQGYTVVYLNGTAVDNLDSPVPIVDQDVTIADIDSNAMEAITVRLTNASLGDQFNVDNTIMTQLGITSTIDNSVPGEITVSLTGRSLNENYETALQAITYENTETDANFDRVTPRIITFEITDGLITTTGAETTITFGVVDGTPNAVPNVYVADEDSTIITTDATGLLANDRDFDSPTITVVEARDSSGVIIPIDAGPTTLPSGATFLMNSDGSFSYMPDANVSGTEFIRYTVSDGTNLTTSWATFNILPVVDPITLNIVQNTPNSDEDAPSAPVAITATVDDVSQTQSIQINSIPLGVVLTDGTNLFEADNPFAFVDVTDWDLTQLRVLPLENSDVDITINVVATTMEADGSQSMDSRSITFEIDAVADPAIVAVDAVGGPIDAEVQIGTAIVLELFDEDGSEAITNIVISNIPGGGQIFIAGVERSVVGGAVSVTTGELADIMFRPPATGLDVIYSLEVFVTTTEIGVENNATTLTNTIGPVPLIIDLNSNDDPVAAVNDTAITGSGVQVELPLLFNDFIPDGGGLVTHIEGNAISSVSPVTLSNGMGEVTMDTSGNVFYTPAGTFSGNAVFTYSMQDLDGSADTASVRVVVQPVWNLSGPATVQEGVDGVFELELFGSQTPGSMASVEMSLFNVDTAVTDLGNLETAIDNGIAANADQGFSRIGNRIHYTAPIADYPVAYENVGTFNDIEGSEDGSLSLGNDGVAATGIGFDFDFFGQSYDTVYVSIDGYVTFGSPVSDPNNVALDGSAFGGRPAIAALWDDLGQGAGSVFVKVSDAPAGLREFTIQWNDVVQSGGGGGTGSFQIVLSEVDGSVQLNYEDVTFGNGLDGGTGATIGIEGPGGLFTQYSANGSQPLVDGSSVTFTRPSAVSPVLEIPLEIVDDPNFEIQERFEVRIGSTLNAQLGADLVASVIDVSDNTAPIAQDDDLVTDEITTVSIDVLNNVAGADSDVEGHALTTNAVNGNAVSVGTTVVLPSGAAVTLQSNGVFSYNPNGAFNGLPPGGLGMDSFDYRVEDEYGASSIATVNVQIDGINIIAVVDLNGPATGGTSFDTSFDPNDPPLLIAAADAEVVDGDDASFPTLTVTLADFLQPGDEEIRIAGHLLTFGTLDLQTVSFGGENVVVNYDGANQIEISLVVGEMSTALVNDILRAVTYQNTSGADLFGFRRLDFVIDDGTDTSLISSAQVQVIGLNTLPIAVDDGSGSPFNMSEDQTITIAAATLLANDSDPDFDPISIESVTGGANGTAVLNGLGDVEFTPNADFNGSTSFTYTIHDGAGGRATATVFVNVQAVVDAPRVDLNGTAMGVDFATSYQEDNAAALIIDGDGFALNPDGGSIDFITVTLTNGFVGDRIIVGALSGGINANITPASAATGIIADGPVTIILSSPATSADYSLALAAIRFDTVSDAPDTTVRTFEIEANANGMTSATATATVSVTATNDAPVAVNDGVYDVAEDTSFIISPADLLANDFDVDLEALTITALNNPVNGSVTLMGDGNIRFLPTANYSGAAFFEYEVSDGNGGVDTALVQLNITPVNDISIIDLDSVNIGTDHADTYFEDGASVSIVSPNVLITDADDTHLTQVTATLVNGQVGDRLFAAAAMPPGITVVINPSSALVVGAPITVSLTGNATLADYQAALQNLHYESTSDNPSIINREIRIVTNDGDDDSAIATSRITVVPVNDAPIAVMDGPLSVVEDDSLTIPAGLLLGNDSDPDNDTITLMSVDNATNGSVMFNGAGDVVFTPDPDYSGPASFEYTINDGNGENATAIVNIDVIAVNDAPFIDLDANAIGLDFTNTFTENGPAVEIVDTTVTLADVDSPELESISVILTNGRVGDQLAYGALPMGISASVTPGTALVVDGPIIMTLFGGASLAQYELALQTITYTSVSEAPDESLRLIEVQADDGDDTSVVATSQISVIGVNDAPIAVADGPFSTVENVALTVAPNALIGNDNDPEGGALTLVSVHTATNGAVAIDGSGNIVFTPVAGFFGNASFEYDVSDPEGEISTATVSVFVQSINDAPELDPNGAAAMGTTHTLTYTENDAAIAVVAADFDIYDQDDTELESAQMVLTNGQIGDLIVAPATVGTVTISVSPVGALAASGPVTVTFTGTGTIADYEAAFLAVTFENTTEEPDTTQRVIEMTAFDGDDTSVVYTTNIHVVSVNDLPVANNDFGLTTPEDNVLSLSPSLLLSNDTDLEAAPLTLTGVSNPMGGTILINGSGNVEFTPDADYFGPAGFDYEITDGDGATAVARASIAVTSVNDAPTTDLNGAAPGASHMALFTEDDGPLAVVDPGIVLTDVDDTNFEGATIALSNGQPGDEILAPASVGPVSISVNPTGALAAAGPVTVTLTGTATLAEYQAALAAVEYVSLSQAPSTDDRLFTVTVNDGDVDSDPVISTIRVVSVNDAPVATADGVILALEDTPITIAPLGNDTDVDGDALQIVAVDGTPVAPGGIVAVANGSVMLNVDGVTVEFTPVLDYNGLASFSYTVSDGSAADMATVDIDVRAQNDAPIALDDGPIVVVEDGNATFDPVAANDSDTEGDPITLVSIDGIAVVANGTINVADGTIDIGADGQTLTFTPDPNFNGTSSISYIISDGIDTGTANVTFDVTAVNDDTVVASAPPNRVFNDGAVVNLPMALHFNDVDGDTLNFVATGLPAGLSINATTGIISGQLSATASLGAPYAITIDATDGQSPVVSVSFSMNVENTLPTASPAQTVPVSEGARFSYAVDGLFNDLDGDVLTIGATGMPSWLVFDASRGTLSGTVPSDAALFGPVTIDLLADDGQGETASTTVTFAPTNVAPIVTTAPEDIIAQETDDVFVDVASLFADGGDDKDSLTIKVSGLPNGIFFSASSGIISGALASGTQQTDPYIVVLTADDGQGGIVTQTLKIEVRDLSSVIESETFGGVAADESEIFALTATGNSNQDTNDDPFGIAGAINELISLSGTKTLDDNDLIVTNAVDKISALDGVTEASSLDVALPDDIFADLDSASEWLGSSQGDLPGQESPYTPLDTSRLDVRSFSIEAYKSEQAIFIEVKVPDDASADLSDLVIALRGGADLPDWMKRIRAGYISANPPADIGTVDIQLSMGDSIVRLLRVDTSDGSLVELTDDDDFGDTSNPIVKKVVEVDPIRGALNGG